MSSGRTLQGARLGCRLSHQCSRGTTCSFCGDFTNGGGGGGTRTQYRYQYRYGGGGGEVMGRLVKNVKAVSQKDLIQMGKWERMWDEQHLS